MNRSVITIAALACAAGLAGHVADAGPKKKPKAKKVPVASIATLVEPREWTLESDEEQPRRITIRAVDQQTIKGIKVARLEGSGEAWDEGVTAGTTPPAFFGVSKKGLWWVSNPDADAKAVAKALKAKPFPYKAVATMSRKDGFFQTVHDDGSVCFGLGPPKGEPMCGDVCEGYVCVDDQGITELGGFWAPDPYVTWKRVATASNVKPTPKQGIAEFKKLRDEACRCKTKACGDAIMKKVEDFAARYADVQGSADEIRQIEDIGYELGVCVGTAQSSGK